MVWRFFSSDLLPILDPDLDFLPIPDPELDFLPTPDPGSVTLPGILTILPDIRRGVPGRGSCSAEWSGEFFSDFLPIPDPDLDFLPIPDPGSGSATLPGILTILPDIRRGGPGRGSCSAEWSVGCSRQLSRSQWPTGPAACNSTGTRS
jgi:hypothetical protein